MTSDERIDKLAESVQGLERTVQNLEQVTRQGFAVLTELQADTQKGMLKLANSMSALADHMADHNARLDKLDGGK